MLTDSSRIDVDESDASGDAQTSRSFQAEIMRHHRGLVAYAQMLEHDRMAAEDLVQDTIERALRAEGRFREGTNLRAWLIRIMRNLFTDRWRHAAVARCTNDVDLISAPAEEPDPVWLELLTMDDIDAAKVHLDAQSRQVIDLAYIDGLSYREIAARTGSNVQTVGSRLFRARRYLRRQLERRYKAAACHPAHDAQRG